MAHTDWKTDALKLIVLTTADNAEIRFFDRDPERTPDYYAARWLGQDVRVADAWQKCTEVRVISGKERWRY